MVSTKLNINPSIDESIFTPESVNQELETISKPHTTTARELLSRKVNVLPTIIPPLFPKVGIGCLAGSSDTGKSAFLRQLCLQIVNDDHTFLGWPISSAHNRALYVSSEDDPEALSFLLQLQNKGLSLNHERIGNLHFIFELDNVFNTIEHTMEQQPFDIVIIDCLTDLYGSKASLNESTHVRAFLNPFKALADKHQCLFVFLHHLGKRSDEFEPNKRALLGSQAIEAKMRFVLELRTDPYDATKRHLCCLKGNYIPRQFKGESFELTFDDHMLFHATGNRTPFENLQKIRPERSGVQREQLIEQAKDLSIQGHSQREIAKQLNISLGAVNGYLNGRSNVHVHENPKE